MDITMDRDRVDGVIFRDRVDAGRRLAAQLLALPIANPVVLALPRGGVPVAFEIARALAAPLDVVIVRKLGAPGHPELGIGAVVDGDRPDIVLNAELMAARAIPPDYLEREAAAQFAVIRERTALYRHGRPSLVVEGRTAIVVDDGLATGGSMRAAIASLKRSRAAGIVVAVPVAPPDELATIRPTVDDVVCLSATADFMAVGGFYDDFRQTSDEEVVRLLDAASGFGAPERRPIAR